MVVNMNIAKNKALVCKKILILGIGFSLFSVVHAQDKQEAPEPKILNQQQEPVVPEQSQENETQAQPVRNSANQQPILRLEDTIRGNKEQPQVLTIVPWQLPVHQRINENEEWQLQVNKLPSIERNAFLRRLAVVNEMKGVQQAQLAKTAQTDTPDK